MLTISPAASAAIAGLLASPGVPSGAGLRLACAEATDEGFTIQIAVVGEPEPEDEVLPTGTGGEVFLEPQAGELLDGTILDADIAPGVVAFTLRQQSLNGGPPGAA